MRTRKIFSVARKTTNLHRKAEAILAAEAEIILIAASPAEKERIEKLLEHRLDFISFSECGKPTEELLKKLKEADAVIIYSRSPEKDAAELAAATLVVSEVTFRYRIVLVGRSAWAVRMAIQKVLHVGSYHFFVLREALAEQMALARAVVLTVPDTVLPALCSSQVLKDMVRRYLHLLLPLLLVKAALVQPLPWGSEFSHELLATVVALMRHFLATPPALNWGLIAALSLLILQAPSRWIAVAVGAALAQIMRLGQR